MIVEDASRFARDLVTQELGILALIKRGMRVLTANGDDLTDSSDPSRKMMRQIAGSFHEYEKARLVAKLKAARDRKRAIGTKVEGRKSHAELNPEMVALARQLRRKRPKGGQRSLREISRELAAAGYLNEHGRPFAPNSIRNMLAAPGPRGSATIERRKRRDNRQGAQRAWRRDGSRWCLDAGAGDQCVAADIVAISDQKRQADNRI